MDFLPSALPFVPGAGDEPDPALAAAVVWFDALMTNVDRTPRNPNLLWWHRRLWLIDHGAALYLQHGTDDLPSLAHRPFPLIGQHVLLPYAGSIAEADERLAPLLTPALVEAVASAVPGEWLGDDEDTARRGYVEYLLRRLEGPRGFAAEAEAARAAGGGHGA
jgi:hypothetical protein